MYNLTKTVIVLIVFFCGLTAGLPQNPDRTIKKAQPLIGLSSPVVLTVHQDALGFMWFGTTNGLYRYDGYEFVIYQHKKDDTSTLSKSSVLKILCENKDGNLWLLTGNSSLDRYNVASDNITRFGDQLPVLDGPRVISITTATADSKGEVWFTHEGLGLLRYTEETGGFSMLYPDTTDLDSRANLIISSLEDSDGIFYVFTREGNFILDRNAGVFTSLIVDSISAEFENAVVTCAVEDEGKTLWLATNKGLFCYEKERGSVLFIDNPFLEGFRSMEDGIPFDNEAMSWMFYNPGFPAMEIFFIINREMFLFDIKDRSFSRIVRHPDDANSIISYGYYFDSSGNLWNATDNRGAVIHDMRDNPFSQFQIKSEIETIEYHNATSFINDSKGNIWIGTYKGGLYQYDRDRNLLDHYFKISDPTDIQGSSVHFIFCLLEDDERNIWVGSWPAGILKIDPESTMISRYAVDTNETLKQKSISVMYQDSRGTMWAGTRNGLYFQNKENLSDAVFETFSLIPERTWIRDICEDPSGSLWVATVPRGVYRIESNESDPFSIVQYDEGSSALNSTEIMTLCYTENGELWVGTVAGMYRFAPEENDFIAVGCDCSLEEVTIYDIKEGKDGTLWISTTEGLVRFSPSSSGKPLYYLLTERDGLPFTEIYPYKIYLDEEGKLYCGGRRNSANSLFVLETNLLQENKRPPPVVINKFQVKNKEYVTDSNIILKQQIELSYRDNFFSFDFAALDFANPDENQYAYFLEGLDDDWTYPGNRHHADYTNVPSGDYVFHVRGSNNFGYWNDKGVSLKIIVQTPPYKSWWAYTMYVLFILAVFLLIVFYYLKRQKLLHRLQLEKIEKQKLEELDGMKSRFFANISHEFRTPLTLILGPLEALKQYVTGKSQAEHIEIINRNALRLQKLIDQLLSLAKLESGQMKLMIEKVDLAAFVKGYVHQFESLAKQKGIELSITGDRERIQIYIDKEKIEKVLYNLLSNAFKFCNAGGEIAVEIGEDLPKKKTYLIVSDTGLGIPPEELPHIFDRFYQVDDSGHAGTGIGLSIVKEFVDLHQGSIDVKSNSGEGTVFTITLPSNLESRISDQFVRKEMTETTIELSGEPDILEIGSAQEFEHDLDEAGAEPVVLVVEDNHDMRAFISDSIRSDFRICEATNGKKGYEKAVEKIPDLILSDVMMPEMNGLELCNKLKSDERTCHIPIILLTARASMEDRLEGFETGADDFLTKPFDREELMVRIRNLVRQRELIRKQFIREYILLKDERKEEILSMDQKFILKAKRIIDEHLSDPGFTVEELSENMALSRYQLHRKFMALLNQSASDFIRTNRLNRAAELLAKKAANVAEIAYDVGFNSPSYFSKCFKEQFGKLPSEYSD